MPPQSFTDVLRDARSSKAPVLHEFWANYDGSGRRTHAFFEGHEDAVFYKTILQGRVGDTRRLYTYRCDGKARVYEVFREITKRRPACTNILFFVDKDIDDILGTPWPTDPRIFVTDVYSIENYLVDRQVLSRAIEELLRFKDVVFPVDATLKHFDDQLKQFYRLVTPIMAWVLLERRSGRRPNLGNIHLHRLLGFASDCSLKRVRGARLGYLRQCTGIANVDRIDRRIRHVVAELNRIPAKRFIRGKFELWFFVEFYKRVCERLGELAEEAGGTVRPVVALEHRNAVELLSKRVRVPEYLDLFLQLHLAPEGETSSPPIAAGFFPRTFRRVLAILKRRPG